MKSLLITAVFLTLLSELTFSRTFRNTNDSIKTKLEQNIPVLIKEFKVPAVGVALIENGKLSWAKVYGELEKGRPAPVDAIFNTASIGKSFTALLALKLANEHKWNLDEPLAHFWVDADIKDHPYLQKLTTRHVLSHRTGFKNWRWLNSSKKLEFDFEPGTSFQYSGEGMEYLRKSLEKKFKKSYADLIADYFFNPLHMTNSQYWSSKLDLSKFAYSHDTNGEIYQNVDYNKPASGAGNIHTTVEDLSKFAIYVLNGAALSPELFSQMTTIQGNEGSHKGFGLGFEVTKELPGGEYALAHGGDDQGVHAQMTLLPKSKRGIIVFTNGDNGKLVIDKIVKELVDLTEKSDDPEPVTLDNKQLDLYIGKYLQTDNRTIWIERVQNILKLRGEGIPLVEITPAAKNKFFIKGYNVKLEFNRDLKDEQMHIAIFQNGKHVMDAQRVK